MKRPLFTQLSARLFGAVLAAGLLLLPALSGCGNTISAECQDLITQIDDLSNQAQALTEAEEPNADEVAQVACALADALQTYSDQGCPGLTTDMLDMVQQLHDQYACAQQ